MRGVFLCYKEAAKIMIKQGTGGKIIGACSTVRHKSRAMISSYSTTKWSVRGLTRAAAMEWAPYNITVNAYCPGVISTPIPLNRIGYSDDVANLVSFLASKNSDYITGQSILDNGGIDYS
ncbi:unnamed protein product [Rotaria sordida]|uniref:Uncharacterized protein n=1 Tax=Rotaria sordida TaxID=392033 RepID=A0A816A5N6_9BILA|nr:unnamed protein product [Rotaria sordida]CAF1593068.1 unnamed protein product [Rotaria sordida]